MGGPPPELSIAVVNWNTRDLLADCLRAVYDTVQGLAFEVLVVDNGSEDDSVALLRRAFPQVRLIENRENVGFARANNQAIRHSQGRQVLLLNSDTRVLDGAVARMVRFLDEQPRAGIVGAGLLWPDGRPQMSSGAFPGLASEVWSLAGLDKWAGPVSRAAAGAAREVDWVVGACLLARRQALDEAGLLDEQFFMFGEEVDLCRRVRDRGWAVYSLPAARVIHVGGGSTGLTPERIVTLYRGKLRYFAKHHGPRARRRLWWAMRALTGLKVAAYTGLRWLSRGRVRRDGLWRAVAAGLRRAEPAAEPA